MGFEDRQSIYDYIKRNDEFSCIIKRAKLFIENEYEVALRYNNVTGAIFALKNMGWKDRQEIDNTHNIKQMPSITIDGKEAQFQVGNDRQEPKSAENSEKEEESEK